MLLGLSISLNVFNKTPRIGDNVYIGTGAKRIGDSMVIGVNAVVTKDFLAGNATLGVIPAKKISDMNSHIHLNSLLKDNKML